MSKLGKHNNLKFSGSKNITEANQYDQIRYDNVYLREMDLSVNNDYII